MRGSPQPWISIPAAPADPAAPARPCPCPRAADGGVAAEAQTSRTSPSAAAQPCFRDARGSESARAEMVPRRYWQPVAIAISSRWVTAAAAAAGGGFSGCDGDLI